MGAFEEIKNMATSTLLRGAYLLFLISAVFSGLYLARLYSYLLFHSLVEMFSVVIACGIFMIAWNTRRLLQNNYLVFVGITYLFVGGLSLIHLLAYKGMGVFIGYDANLPTQLWIATRYLEAVSMFVAPLFLDRKVKPELIFTGHAAATSLLLISIFHWRVFPDCYVEGVGLTAFKTISEYVICALFLASALLLYFRRRYFQPRVFRLIVTSIFVAAASDLMFTAYVNVYDFSNLLGHFLIIVSSYLFYKAIIETGLVRPYDLLFLELKRSEQRLFSLLEEMPAFVYLQSQNYSIGFANAYFRNRFGAPDGRRCYQVLHGRDEPCVHCTTFEVFETKNPQQMEWRRSDAEVYQVYDYFFSDIDGTPHVLKLGIDITDRKKTEEATRKVNEELEERVRERTLELMRTNEILQMEILERKRMEEALRESEKELRLLSSRLLAAQEEERKRIAMELHDSIGASLAAVKFGIENALNQMGNNLAEAARKRLEAVVPTLQNAVDEVRRMHTGIWPSILDDLGILMAVRWLTRQFQSTYPGIHIEVDLDIEEDDVGDSLKIVIYRVVQEALNNIAKHSRARIVHVDLKKEENALLLTIVDNGAGFDIRSTSEKENVRRGVGLSSMRERTKLSGGVFEVSSSCGVGTTVKASWAVGLQN